MKGLSLRNMVWVSMVMVMMMVKFARPELHYVGGSKTGWTSSVNFSEWSSHEHFYVGDWLFFGFDKTLYNVLEVNNTSYENCAETGFIKNVTKGGRDVFQLMEAKPYYFICGYGRCFNGMKVAINVEEFRPTPAPAAHKSGSAFDSGIQVTPLLVLLSTMVFTFLFKLY